MEIESIYKILLNSINIKQKSNSSLVALDLLRIWSLLTNEIKCISQINGSMYLDIACKDLVENKFSKEYDLQFIEDCMHHLYFGEETKYVIHVYLARLER